MNAMENRQSKKNFPQQIRFRQTDCQRGWIGWFRNDGATLRNKLHTCTRKPDHGKKCRCVCGAKRRKP